MPPLPGSTRKVRRRISESRTTRHVAAGTAAGVGSGGLVLALLGWVRATWPDVLPWPVDADVALAGLITTILAPLLSRFIATQRRADK